MKKPVWYLPSYLILTALLAATAWVYARSETTLEMLLSLLLGVFIGLLGIVIHLMARDDQTPQGRQVETRHTASTRPSEGHRTRISRNRANRATRYTKITSSSSFKLGSRIVVMFVLWVFTASAWYYFGYYYYGLPGWSVLITFLIPLMFMLPVGELRGVNGERGNAYSYVEWLGVGSFLNGVLVIVVWSSVSVMYWYALAMWTTWLTASNLIFLTALWLLWSVILTLAVRERIFRKSNIEEETGDLGGVSGEEKKVE